MKYFILRIFVEFFIKEILPEITETVSEELKESGVTINPEVLKARQDKLAERIRKRLKR